MKNMSNTMHLSTGDLKNNLRKLQNQLRSIQCPHELDLSGKRRKLAQNLNLHRKIKLQFKHVRESKFSVLQRSRITAGSPTAYLPLYHYALLEYSKPISQFLVEHKIELFAKSDMKFIESMFHALRELFNYRPPLNKDQFFTNGFVECKVIMCVQIIHLIHAKHKELIHGLTNSRRLSNKSSRMEASSSANSRETGHFGSVGAGSGILRPDVAVLSHLSGDVLHSGVKNTSSSNSITSTAFIDRDLSANRHHYPHGATNFAKNTNHIFSSAENAVGCKSENCVRKLGVRNLKDKNFDRQSDTSDEGKQPLAEASTTDKPIVFTKRSVSVVRESNQSCNGISRSCQRLPGFEDGGSGLDDKCSDEHCIAKNESEKFLFNMLSSVSQTLVELVRRVDFISERVTRLESSVFRQSSNISANSENDCDSFQPEYDLNRYGASSQLNLNGVNNASVNSVIESQVTGSQTRNESKENDLSKVLRNTEGKLLQSLNTINARITLLENSVTLLSSNRHQAEQQQHHQYEQEQRSEGQPLRQQYLDESKQPYSQPLPRPVDRRTHLLETEEFIEGIESPKSTESLLENVKDWRNSGDQRNEGNWRNEGDWRNGSNWRNSGEQRNGDDWRNGGDWRSNDDTLRSNGKGNSSSKSVLDNEHQNSRLDNRLSVHSSLAATGQDLRLELQEPTNDDSLITVDSCQSSHPATPPSLRNSSRIVDSPPTRIIDYKEQAQRIEAILQSTQRLLSNNTS